MEKVANGIKLNAEQLQGEADNAIKRLVEINASPKWEKKDEKPCLIYSMKVEDRLVIKGMCNIKATLEQLEAHIDNEKNYLPDNVSENKVLMEGQYGQVKHRRHKAPWPADDRDLVIIKNKRK